MVWTSGSTHRVRMQGSLAVSWQREQMQCPYASALMGTLGICAGILLTHVP